MVTYSFIKMRAKQLSRGADIKLSVAYEVLAAEYGFKNWNSFCAALKSGQKILPSAEELSSLED